MPAPTSVPPSKRACPPSRCCRTALSTSISTTRRTTPSTRSTASSSIRTSPPGRHWYGWRPTARSTSGRKHRRMSEQVLSSLADGVCELSFNRPEKRNAITHHMYQALAGHLHVALADQAVRAVLLSGTGASFSAGNDLNDFLTGPEFTSVHPVMDVLRTLATFDKPLVAAVHGTTVGIGVTMLLHCDLVVAAQGTQLIMPFVALGLVPEAGSSLLLPRLLGQQRAAELLLLGQPLDAAEAQRLGLVNRVAGADKLLEEARSHNALPGNPWKRCAPPNGCCAGTQPRCSRASKRRHGCSVPASSRRSSAP